MILYQLKCRHDHRFEAWFRDSKAFDKQAKRHDIECPDCGDISIEKAPMAPSISSGRRRDEAGPRGEDTGPRSDDAGRRSDDAGRHSDDAGPRSDDERALETAKYLLREMRKIREHVEKTCDYVGENFAEEARKIHYGETDERGIYGETTKEEAIELVEEDIPVKRIPWPVRKNS